MFFFLQFFFSSFCWWNNRENFRTIRNSSKNRYNSKLYDFLFWNYSPLSKKYRINLVFCKKILPQGVVRNAQQLSRLSNFLVLLGRRKDAKTPEIPNVVKDKTNKEVFKQVEEDMEAMFAGYFIFWKMYFCFH